MSRSAVTPAVWTAADVPDQQGRTIVVTGASAGLGFETARVLAARGATVVLACRDRERADTAARRIRAESPEAALAHVRLDLASLASVREAAEQLRAEHPRIDGLVNNAGIAAAGRRVTEDGFEAHLGVNHLGHFALTGLVIDLLLPVPGARVVTVSSNGHAHGQLDFDDLQMTGSFTVTSAYGRSKLANLMFGYELQRRLDAAGAGTLSVAAHPGNAYTEVGRDMPLWMRLPVSPRLRLFNSWMVQDADRGALPVLRAATDPQVRGGDYYGPDGRNQFTGHPVRVRSTAASYDTQAQQRLWQVSEELTGVTYRLPEPSADRRA